MPNNANKIMLQMLETNFKDFKKNLDFAIFLA